VPLWWNNGGAILFTRLSASGAQVIAKPADGTGQEQLLFEGAASDLSRSGKYLLVTRESADGKITSGYVSMADPQRKIVPLPETLQRFYWMRLSPDDRLLAYHSPESGNDEVYVMDFPAFTQRRVVSRGWGRQPEWHPKGTELFYFGNNGQTLMSARLKTSAASFEEPEKVFDLPESTYSDNPWRMSHLDITPQGDRFLMLRNVRDSGTTNQAPRPNVLVVENWLEEFPDRK
jgi:Tol biopolymer transport system component